MANRVALGKIGSDFGIKVSKKGQNALTATNENLLFDSTAFRTGQIYAGGFDLKAKKGSTYVVYANGDVARTRKFLFFNIYPKAEPGCEVIVPKKPVKSPLAASQILNFSTGLAALILAINQIK